jgi:hypothetical protein
MGPLPFERLVLLVPGLYLSIKGWRDSVLIFYVVQRDVDEGEGRLPISTQQALDLCRRLGRLREMKRKASELRGSLWDPEKRV